MKNHTLGPWQLGRDNRPWTCGDSRTAVEEGTEFGHTEVLSTLHAGDESEPIAHLVWEPLASEQRQAEVQANADLIVAAPDMYRVLCRVLANPTEPNEWLRDVQNVVRESQ